MPKKPPPRRYQDITRANLMSPDAVAFLGSMASRSLELFGQVTFILRGDGAVAMANPVHVYLDANAAGDGGEIEGEDLQLNDPGKPAPYRFVRPVLGQGKPQYVAWKNGELWEIEFTDEQAQKTASD